MVALGVVLLALSFHDVLPSSYAMAYFGCLGMQILTGPWWKHPIMQASNASITRKHVRFFVGFIVASTVISALTSSALMATPLFGLIMEYTYFRWVDKMTLAEKVQ